jgi:hypothetical protein
MGQYIVFPSHVEDMNRNISDYSSFNNASVMQRLTAFGGDRKPLFYDSTLQKAHHIHIRGDGQYRVLQHHYGSHFLNNIRFINNDFLSA